MSRQLTGFLGGVDTFCTTWGPVGADIDPMSRVMTNLAATRTELTCWNMGLTDDGAEDAQLSLQLPFGVWFLSHVAIRYGGSAVTGFRVHVSRNCTDDADASSGVDLISNILTNGTAKVAYIACPVGGALETTLGYLIRYDAPQAGGGAVDDADPAVGSTGFVEASRVFDATLAPVTAATDLGIPSINVSVTPHSGTTSDVIAPMIVDVIFSRIGS